MADRFPLVANASAGQIQELPSGDNLNLSNNSIVGVGTVTATTFLGDGSQLTGISAADATALKDSNGATKIQANTSGAVHTGIATFSGDATFNSTITAGGATGNNGQYLKSTGSGVAWDSVPS